MSVSGKPGMRTVAPFFEQKKHTKLLYSIEQKKYPLVSLAKLIGKTHPVATSKKWTTNVCPRWPCGRLAHSRNLGSRRKRIQQRIWVSWMAGTVPGAALVSRMVCERTTKSYANMTIWWNTEEHDGIRRNAKEYSGIRRYTKEYEGMKKCEGIQRNTPEHGGIRRNNTKKNKEIRRNRQEYVGIRRNTQEYKGIRRNTKKYEGIQKNT